MKIYPTKLQLASDNLLRIAWSNGQQREYTVRELRDSCTCASCRGGHKDPRAGPPAENAEPLRITGMKPVGHYAYAISFSDGHDTGIYTLERLQVLGRELKD